jgi:hypothetical protein
MKKIIALSAAVGLLVSMALAVEVRSINTVGYHMHTVDPGDLCFVAPTVDNQDGDSLNDIFGSQLPVNSAAFIWNGLGFDTSIRTVFFGWSPNFTVLRGQAVFVQNSATAPGPVTFALRGEVPEARNAGGTTAVSVTSLDGVAYPYPTDIEFGDTQAAIAAPVNSSVFFWNKATQAYDPPTTKVVFFGWGATDAKVVPVGEAYFMDVPSPVNVDEVQPYDLAM